MKKVRLIVSMCFAIGLSIIGASPVFAVDLGKTAATTPNKQVIPKVVEKEMKTTDTAIKFAEDEYLRITQPISKEDTKTFEKQLNVMGEARANTKATITVYYENPEQRVIAGKAVSKTYELSEVGATQTFNQLIDLEVGKNKIVIKYEYGKVAGSYELYIVRQSEVEKEQLKNFLVNDSSAILDKIKP